MDSLSFPVTISFERISRTHRALICVNPIPHRSWVWEAEQTCVDTFSVLAICFAGSLSEEKTTVICGTQEAKALRHERSFSGWSSDEITAPRLGLDVGSFTRSK